MFVGLLYHSLQYGNMLRKCRKKSDTEPSREEIDRFCLLSEIFNQYIKQNIIMAVLKK